MNNFDSEHPFGYFLEDYKFDELSKFIQSHFQKNNAVNNMAESNIPMYALIFLCGWEKKSLHTIFIYLFTSIYNDMRREKTLFHCFFKKTNGIYLGATPTLDNKKTEPDLVNFSVDSLFFHITQLTYKTKFKRILAAVVLIFHDVFIGIIGN